MRNIFVFIPDTLEKSNIGFVEGCSRNINNNLTFYITNNKFTNSFSKSIGYCSANTPGEYVLNHFKDSGPWIHINNKYGEIEINCLNQNEYVKIQRISYDYNAFKHFDLTTFKCQNYGEHFEALATVVQENNCVSHQSLHYRNNQDIVSYPVILLLNLMLILLEISIKVYNRFKFLLCFSATAAHLNANAITMHWVLRKIKNEHKVTLSVGNAIVSKITDFLCGLALLYFILQYETEFINFIQTTTESIIQGLEQLLNFLMGSPVGLKLNYAFNKTLGRFFLYHISLWRAFLQATSPLLMLGLYLLVIPGAFGLSFQTALLSDLVTFSTFHVYCIYVYAARLYGVQIRGLTSLWRLFIGRKYNPLRERIDSHQYTHHQLFIGTLGFTVLLFLLPTTFLYYGVFTVFRIGLITLDGMLIRLRYVLQCLPLYVSILWLINFPSVKGAVKLEVRKKTNPGMPIVHATLQTLSFWQSIVNSIPPTVVDVQSISWSHFLHSITKGTLLEKEK